MPPRKAKAKASLPLDGCSVAIGGSFPGTNQTQVNSLITSLGATVASSVNADITCLVSTKQHVDKSSVKVKAAQEHDIPIVTIDWLNDCSESSAKKDMDSYLIGGSAATSASQKTNGKKTAASKANGSQEDYSKATKSKATGSQSDAPKATTSKGRGKKRAASPEPAPSPEAEEEEPQSKKQKKAEFGQGSISKSKSANIPLDDYNPLTTHRVYIDDGGIIYDASLNQTNASANNNKFYRVQLVHNPASGDFKTWTRWGRVGERGQNAILGNGSLEDAFKQYGKKFKDKSGIAWEDRANDPKPGKYAYVERNYGPDSDDDDEEDDARAGEGAVEKKAAAKCTLELPIQSLMELIFNQDYLNAAMSDLNYDAKKMPLGKLSLATIKRGFQTLKDLAALLDNNSNRAEIENLSNRYYSLIPHDFGRNRPPVIADDATLKKELELLDSLGDMKEAAEMMKERKDKSEIHLLDRQFQGLGLQEMTVLDPNDTEFKELSSYLVNSRGATHGVNYHVENIFRIQRSVEAERFKSSKFAGIKSDRRLLWHGSRATNYGGILSQGLRIAPPEAPVSGYMFGKGIYLADMSSKSAGYCASYISGGHALLLLCEAELGDPMQKLTGASYNAGEEAIAKGSWSTWGQGRTGPSKWKDAGCVHDSLAGIMMPDMTTLPGDTNVTNAGLYYNEYIAYDVAQVQLRYLFRVKLLESDDFW